MSSATFLNFLFLYVFLHLISFEVAHYSALLAGNTNLAKKFKRVALLTLYSSVPVIASIWSIYVFDDNSACNVFVSGVPGQWVQ